MFEYSHSQALAVYVTIPNISLLKPWNVGKINYDRPRAAGAASPPGRGGGGEYFPPPPAFRGAVQYKVLHFRNLDETQWFQYTLKTKICACRAKSHHINDSAKRIPTICGGNALLTLACKAGVGGGHQLFTYAHLYYKFMEEVLGF